MNRKDNIIASFNRFNIQYSAILSRISSGQLKQKRKKLKYNTMDSQIILKLFKRIYKFNYGGLHCMFNNIHILLIPMAV
jgi:hypothetical protein